jgi:prepilin-type N-terminal cleavage/methylation domain-containing protein
LLRRSSGFTLTELVIVLLVLGILAATAAPKYFDSLARFRAEAAAKRIAGDLQLARRNAISKSASQSVQFNSPGANQYRLLNFDDPHRPGDPYVVNLALDPFACGITSASFGGDATVVFSGFGRPDSGGTVTVQSGQHQCTVTLDADSGKVVVQ